MSGTEPHPPAPHAPPVTRAGMVLGVRRVSVLLPGIIVFAVAFGAAAAAKGMTLPETLLMSGLVYGGVSQLVAMELWRPEWTWGAIAGLTVVTATVNARMILQGAALQPWFAHYPKRLNAFHLFFYTDANWLIGTRYHDEGGRDLGVLIGAGLALWVVWVLATIPGHVLGALVSDPRRYGIDLVMPIFFAAMIVPMWRGRRAAVPWLVAGFVALVTAKLVEGYAFIIAGSLAGALTGAFRDDAA
ncbi:MULTISPECIES: AzlC family ABC transporter permease [unclassified Bosea (in: a-proteobacteria)]|uniref:AzlC family ABC transporter permease n=1 Tax=unclassified Bosea (in: a-proteobacteria) TaxID=2653178 RepID=UPI0009561B82|nr:MULTISPECIES: AzlC family ABC transporter permease [unclassified Bosea (in: a-proteobacteria)]TAJ28104.1 MAG: branched-chain amino acid ABC transporter permease [Bosea sp. (in: a-proteobacteria)]SIQ05510.1 Predicted branched-chain amino acid permease (azaleucine resistance) [Bosea sp. TND4EK4]